MAEESHPPVNSTNPGRSRWEGWRRYLLLYALALLLLGGVAWAAISAGYQLRDSLALITRLQSGNKELAVFLQQIVDLETAQRGFLLTQDDKYLQPYRSAESNIDAQIAKVYTDLGGSPAMHAALDAIAEETARKRDEVAASLLLYRQQGAEAALAMVRSGLGRAAMDSLRLQIANLSNDVRGEIATQQTILQEIVAMRNRNILVSLVLAIAASLAALILLRRHLLALRNEEHLRTLAERSDSASREKSAFLANMSHEIRTPMNAIFGFSQLLAERVTDAEDKRYVDAIVSSGRALLALINDVLDLSKIEAGKLDVNPVPMSLREAIDSAIVVFRELALEKGLGVSAHIDPHVPDGLALDPVRLRQMLFNLIGNAVKYTDKGHIVVRASATPRGDDETHVDCLIEVEDTGIGIGDADLERIFDPFTQARAKADRREGTGLGLSITRRLAQLMNGRISVDSAIGKGSCFRIHLAEVALVPLPESVPLPKGKLSDLPQSVILVADDVALNRQLIQAMFRGSRHRLIEAQDGLQAVQLVRSERPDLVLMDIRMPRMDGNAALDEIRADASLDQIRVIAVTASSMLGEESRLRQRFDGYIRKPLSLEVLYAELRRVMDRYGSPQRAVAASVLAHPEEWPVVRASLGELENGAWQALRATLALRESVRFGETLGVLAERCGSATLNDYAARLRGAAVHADTVALEQILDGYPALLRELDHCHSEIT